MKDIAEKRMDIMQDELTYKYSGPFKKAIDIADYYGFKLVRPLPGYNAKQDEKTSWVPSIDKESAIEFYQSIATETTNPRLICHTRAARKKNGYLRLEVLGCSKSIAEALLIKTASAILEEHGHQNLRIELNSFGNREARENFIREFTLYYRKNISSIGECCQAIFRTNALDVAYCSNSVCVELRSGAPRPIEFLNEDGRRHLMELLEYIETMNFTYRINDALLGHHETHSRTLFQIVAGENKEGEKPKVLAFGDRYDHVTKRLRYRTIVPAVGISILLGGGKTEAYKEARTKQTKKPHVFYIHLGVEAKRLSLPLLEELRRSNISVWASLLEDSLANQMALAEQTRAPYTIIMGLKEVQERSVIVRDMNTRAQETVPLQELPRFLRKIVKK